MADGSDAILAAARYCAFAFAALVAPSLAILRLLRLQPEPALVLPLGLLFTSLAYQLSLALGAPWLAPAFLGVIILAGLTAARFGPPLYQSPVEPGRPRLTGAVVPILLLVVLFAVTQYPVNRLSADGAFLLDLGEHRDTALHAGLSFELVAGYPPEVPGLAGVDMHYHLGSDLVRAAAARWAGIHPYDSLNRFEITLLAASMVLALRAVAHGLRLGGDAVVVAGFLPLATDFSFVPGLALGSPWWAFKLGGNLVEATFYANSIMPALLLVLGTLMAVSRAQGHARLRWLVVAGALAAGVAQFKVFTGVQLLLALSAAWLVQREKALLGLALPVAASLGLLVWGSTSMNTVPGVEVSLAPLGRTNVALTAFGLDAAHGITFALFGVGWILLSLGFRVFGLPGAWHSLSKGDASRAVAGAFALSGWPIGTLVSIRADPGFDESFYFLQASGLLLWLFAAPVLLAFGRRTLLLGVPLVGLALVPTGEFVMRKMSQTPEIIPSAAVRAMAALREASCPGDVVLSQPDATEVPLPVVLAGRRVVLADYIDYWQQFTTAGDLASRRARLGAFFEAPDREAAIEVARQLGARYAYLRGDGREPVETTGALELLFYEGLDRVYRIGSDRGSRRGECRAQGPRQAWDGAAGVGRQ